MNYEWVAKTIQKKSNPKNWKNSKKSKTEIDAREQKTFSGKAHFCSNTVFSLLFKIRVKKFHATKPLGFAPLPVSASPKSLLQFDSKNQENV